LPGKDWDPINGQPKLLISMKAVAMLIGYMNVQSMLRKHMVPKVTYPSKYCAKGCPVLDAGAVDNGPLSVALSHGSMLPVNLKPRMMFMNGPVSGFAMFDFQFGRGPLNLYQGIVFNLCPFTQAEFCKVLGQIKDIVRNNLSPENMQRWETVRNTFAVYLPQNQILSPYCGDPISFDSFKQRCKAHNFCSIVASVVPSTLMQIKFNPEPYLVLLAVTYVGATSMSAAWAEDYIPSRLFRNDAFRHLTQWFPNFQFIAPSKGGMAFTRPLGHSLLGFLVFLSQRLTTQMLAAKIESHNLYRHKEPECAFLTYERIHKLNVAKAQYQINDMRDNIPGSIFVK
jgi:hypothetical protein